MLDASLKSQLQTYLQYLKSPVELVVALDNSDKAGEIKALAADIAGLSPLVSVKEETDLTVRTPSMAVRGTAKNSLIRFAGVPLGHEFTSLVLALLHSGGHTIKEEQAVLEQIASLTDELNFEVFVSLSCQTCPEVVQALNVMAAVNPKIKTTMIDGAVFQDEVSKRNIMAVPTVFLNGQQFSQGAISLTNILNKVDSNAAARQAEALKTKAPYDMLIVGGGPAGASAAIYSARKGLRTGVVAERFGGQVADTVGIENFISVKETEGPKLVANLEAHVRQYDVDVMNSQKAVKLRQGTEHLELELANGAVLKAKSLVLSTGARWREMNVPGEKEYRGKGVAYCPHCDGPLFKGKKVAVIGGGNSGIEAALDLSLIVEHVTVLEFDSSLRADAVLVKKAESTPNITIIKQAQTTEVLGDGNKVVGLQYTDRATGESKTIELAGIFVQIGLVPNTEWLRGAVELTNRGEIIVDGYGKTSLNGVYAAGDATNTPFKQIIIAMGSGATAALGAFDHLLRS
ncbi:alkyl hydroperoxide reductase subunit F [Rheinheimera sp.]|uniref:alkyl hydroperoxide reductase subunit F n=1 Tax=Rheinheimera sp. TaxID=1869214 RepID=UPI00307D4D1A